MDIISVNFKTGAVTGSIDKYWDEVHNVREDKTMKFDDAIRWCHVRSAIYRESKPRILYYKNHTIPLSDRVPPEDQAADDWKEYDPADDYPPYYRLA